MANPSLVHADLAAAREEESLQERPTMTARELDDLLRELRGRGEALLFVPPNEFEIVLEPIYPGAPIRRYETSGDEHQTLPCDEVQ